MTPRALVLAGPTASGKSALAMALAQHIELEIISVDSAQVYRGMDVGTAKPSLAERAQVPHHLIDILDPAERYSAARFASDATRLIADINQRGRVALLVGGTMLYLKALLQGLDTLPEADPRVRAAIDARAAARGLAGAARGAGARRPRHRGAPGAARRATHPACARGVAGQRAGAVAAAGPTPAGGLAVAVDRAGAARARLAACAHRRALRPDAAARTARRSARLARARRPARRAAVDALRGLPPGLAGAGQRLAATICASAASPPRASSPSAS